MIFLPASLYSQEAPRFKIHEGTLLTLPDAVNIALINNPTIESMLRALERSEYLYRAASKEGLPTVTVDYSFTGFPTVPEMEMEGMDSGDGDSSFPLTTSTELVLGVHARMPIYMFGAMKYRKTMALLGIDVARLKYLETRADLIQQVTINYNNVIRLQNYSEVVTQNLKRFINHEEVTSHYFDTGLIAKNTLLEVRAKRANVQQELFDVEKDLKIARAALCVTMGIDIYSGFVVEEKDDMATMPYSEKECFEMAKQCNPSLAVYTYLKCISETDVKLTKTDLWPKIYGDISYYRHGRTPALDGDDYYSNDIVMGMVKAEWKVFDWFKTMDLANAKKKEVEMLVNNLRSLEDRVGLDIREDMLALKAAKNKVDVAKRGVEYAEENYRITELRYVEKVAPSTEVNDALVLLRKSRFNYYTAFYQYNVAMAKMERVIGKNDLCNQCR